MKEIDEKAACGHACSIRVPSLQELKALPKEEIPALIEELRRFLIDKVCHTGGHLASNLGVVELTVALHRVFDSPHDRILFDVGHQSYVHKILTGRGDAFDTLRTPGGLSGFPSPRESEHDAFVAGHSSTSLSVALGFAEAARLAGSDAYTVAVVGDGAFTGGMIHEALNNCRRELNLILVLNDNDMSISRSTGLLSRYFYRLRGSRGYISTKVRTLNFLSRLPLIGRPLMAILRFFRNLVRRLLFHHNYFEDLGLRYYGPVDGHDERLTERILAEAKRRGGASVIHVYTQKGHGFSPAESDPTGYHGLAPDTVPPTEEKSFSQTVGETLADMADTDGRILAVTAAMSEGTGLSAFAERHPDRFFDVGIAEGHALTFTAALSAAGMKPYFAVYSTFLQRAYDSLMHDAAIEGLPVRLLVDRAGLSHGDGATHHGIFDVAFASTVPGMTVWCAATRAALLAMMSRADGVDGPLLIRYSAGCEMPRVARAFDGERREIGLCICGEGEADAVILTYGRIADEALSAQETLSEKGIRVHVYLLEAICPYAESAARILAALPARCPVLFLEEGAYAGGAAMHTHEALVGAEADFDERHPWRTLAVRDGFARPDAPVSSLYAHCGIDAASVAFALCEMTAQEKE